MLYMGTMEYYSHRKNKIFLSFATTEVNLKSVLLSEVSQMEKDKYHTISLICESLKKRKNVIDTKMRLVIVTIGEGGWRWAK